MQVLIVLRFKILVINKHKKDHLYIINTKLYCPDNDLFKRFKLRSLFEDIIPSLFLVSYLRCEMPPEALLPLVLATSDA